MIYFFEVNGKIPNSKEERPRPINKTYLFDTFGTICHL